MKAKYLVKLLYMAIYIANTAITPPSLPFFCVFSLKIASPFFINLTILRYCIGRQSKQTATVPQEMKREHYIDFMFFIEIQLKY